MTKWFKSGVDKLLTNPGYIFFQFFIESHIYIKLKKQILKILKSNIKNCIYIKIVVLVNVIQKIISKQHLKQIKIIIL